MEFLSSDKQALLNSLPRNAGKTCSSRNPSRESACDLYSGNGGLKSKCCWNFLVAASSI